VHRYDNRLRTVETSNEESLTQDGINVVVGMYAAWRIKDPILFLRRVDTVEKANANLDGLIRDEKGTAFGRHPLRALVNTDAAELRIDAIEQEILEGVRAGASERYGIEVATVGIHLLELPGSITDEVFNRMRSERDKLAEKYRAQGNAEATKIKARADSEAEKVLSMARADAKRKRAEGDAAAVEYFKVFEQDPALATYLRDLEVLEAALGDGSTLVLSPENKPFHLLKESPDAVTSP
jgi:membrane protease subunit HflC